LAFELVALDLADTRFVTEGMVLTLRRRKTDQEGQGTEIAIPFDQSGRTCPVLTLRAWLEVAGITSGPVFVSITRGGKIRSVRLSPIDVARAVKAAVEAAGGDPDDFSGHSLRSGFITSAARAGVAERHIQNQSGHRSLPVLRGYTRRGSLFVDNAAAKVGL
jgi:integrase